MVFVIEDLHWADASTLDFVRFAARRIDGTHVLVVVTYRDDDLLDCPTRCASWWATSPRSRWCGGSGCRCCPARRWPSSSADSGIDVEALHRETGGNAFFVSEVIASGGTPLPPTVQDAVLSRRASTLAAGPPGAGVGGRGRRRGSSPSCCSASRTSAPTRSTSA